jgi:PST family polysaccharide transporter
MSGRRRGTVQPRRTGTPGASNALGWSLLNTIASRFATLGIGIVLARVLGPSEFGTFAVALVVLMAVLSFNELGVSLAIVRWPGDPAVIAPTVNSISVLASLVVYAAAYAATPALANAMGDPGAVEVVRLLLLSVLVNGAVATPAALLQRRFRERTRMAIDQANVWIGAAVSVALAIAGMGAMSLAVGRLAGSAVSGIMFVRSSPLPYRFGWNSSVVPALLRFGLPLAGTSIIVFAVGYADQLIAGSLLGSTALGFYVLAFNLSSWPMSLLSQPLRRVAPATFSHLQADKQALRRAVTMIFGLLAACTLPLFAFVSGAAVPLVRFIYGDAWFPAAAILSFLVFSALCKLLYEMVYDYLVVLGKSGTVFLVQGASLVVMVPALVAGARIGGLVGLAIAQAVVSWTVILPLYLVQLSRAGVGLRAVARRCATPAGVGLLVGGFSYWMAAEFRSSLATLAVGGVLVAIASASLLYVRRRDIFELRGIGRPAEEHVASRSSGE